MPTRKTVEVPVAAAAEPKKARAASKPKAPATKHKRATKNAIDETSVTPELVAESAPLATVTPAISVPEPTIEKPRVTSEAVANLAYSYWVARGFQGGSPEHDWLRAERELHSN